MSKKQGRPFPVSGNDFIKIARDRGANVKEGGMFTAIETPSGKTFINPGDHKLDPQTISNLKRWFRLLGLMLIPFICLFVDYFVGLRNLWWIIIHLNYYL